jgi:hypothetical protein
MFFRRPSSTLTLVLPRWFGTVVVVVAADMAATVAAAVVDSVAVSVYLSFLQALKDAC